MSAAVPPPDISSPAQHVPRRKGGEGFIGLVLLSIFIWIVGEAATPLQNKGGWEDTTLDFPAGQGNLMAEDGLGRVWILTTTELLAYARDDKVNTSWAWKLWGLQLPGQVTAIEGSPKRGSIWLGGEDWLYQLSLDGNELSISKATDLPDCNVTAILPDQEERVWVGCRNLNGILSYDGVWKQMPFPDSETGGEWITSLAADTVGNLAVGTNRHLYVLDRDNEWHTLEVDGIKSVEVVQNDELFAVNSQNEWLVFQGPSLQWPLYSRVKSCELTPIEIYDRRFGRQWLYEPTNVDCKNYILCTGSDNCPAYTSENSGLTSLPIREMAVDGQGNLYVRTDVGLSIISPATVNNPINSSVSFPATTILCFIFILVMLVTLLIVLRKRSRPKQVISPQLEAAILVEPRLTTSSGITSQPEPGEELPPEPSQPAPPGAEEMGEVEEF